MTKEKKYYLTGTDEEVVIGDVVEVPMIKKLKDGRVIKKVMECKITEDTIPYALDMRLIEEVESEEESDELIDFNDENCPYDEVIQDIIETQEELEKRLDSLEEKLKVSKTLIDDLYKKNVSSKKK